MNQDRIEHMGPTDAYPSLQKCCHCQFDQEKNTHHHPDE
jgi:hypothetical protein